MSVFQFLYKLSTTKQLFKYLRQRYNKTEVGLINKVIGLKQKICRLIVANNFFNECIQNKVVPNSIKSSILRAKVHQSPVIERAFINDRIQKNLVSISDLKRSLQKLSSNLLEFISDLDYLKLCRHILLVNLKYKTKQTTKDNISIQFLKQKRFGNGSSHSLSNINNLSSYQLSTSEKSVLRYGLKFCVPPKKVRREQIFSEFEVLAGQLKHHVPSSKECKQRLMAKMQDLAYSYCGTPLDLGDFQMNKENYTVAQQLMKNNNLVISKPDKGSGMVILDRSDYVSKMMSLLSDESKFTKCGPSDTYDFTVKIESAFQRRFRKLLKQKIINRETYNAIRPVGSQTPKMYGLPKTHKVGVPLRPVLSMIGTPQYNLSKWLIKILQPVNIKLSKFVTVDSFSFSKFINQLKLNSVDNYLCSFDIKSLFTNVPLTYVTQICSDYLYNSDLTPPTIPRTIFEEFLTLATTNVEFSFNQTMFKQIDGVAMGSPLGPVLANIFVGHLEAQLLSNDATPLVYTRYVDDTFAIFNNIEDSKCFLAKLERLHPSLQYTCEGEENGSLPFLDVLVHRVGSSFETSVHRKVTFTGDYVPWNSFTPIRRKTSLIACLVHRALVICSPSRLDPEIKKIFSIFRDLGYPEDVIQRTIRAKLKTSAADNKIGPQKCPVYIHLPYIGSVANRFEQTLSRSIYQCYSSVQLRVIFGTRALLVCANKDRSPTHHKSNVVYNFKCFCDRTYVGRTK